MCTSRRALWLLALCAFLFMSSGCHSTKAYPPTDEMSRKGTKVGTENGQKIAGYTLTDGTVHKRDGYVARSGEDSLRFFDHRGPYNSPFYKNEGPTGETYSIDEVAEIQVIMGDPMGTIGTVMLSIVGVMVVLAGVAVVASCPFLYSYDGEQYIFDGEPYGGATMSSLQRTDFSQLEHMVATDGEYRLAVRNAVDETQHTDALHLVVADHPPGTHVVMDYEGGVHGFRELVSLSAAYDEQEKDLLVWLREQDAAGWYPDLRTYAAMDSLPDTCNHITLEFPRPLGVDRAHLVANVGTGQWGSHMIRVMLAMRGNQVQDFYDAVNTNPEFHSQLMAWNAREDIFVLDVEIEVGDHWETRGYLHGGGPFISELRTIPLDLSGIEGDTVRLRVHPPIGFWRFDTFQLAVDEVAVELTTLPIVSAFDDLGNDVQGVFAVEDGDTFDQPTHDEWAELRFAAPPPAVDMERTIFAVTSGWYEIHLYNDGEPEYSGLQRLTYEPGYVVRRAMSEFREAQETGKLGYTKPEAVAW